MKIVLYDKVYIPKQAVYDIEQLKQDYTFRFYKDAVCAKCEYREDRHSHMCDVCPAYDGASTLFKERRIGSTYYIGLPFGDKKKIQEKAGIDFSEFQIVDKRTATKFEYSVKFTLELREPQKKLVRAFMRKKYGQVKAPPRFGKTLCILHMAIALGLKVVIIASQHEFLKQFIWHVEGNDAAGIPKCTNLPELEKKYGKKLYGIPKTAEDWATMQIVFCTYQQFLSEGRGSTRLALMNKNFGTVAVDEIHKAGATGFARVLNKTTMTYRFGCTGTNIRKDGKHKLVSRIVGPVTAKSEVEAMTPKVFVVNTGVNIRKPPKHWTYAMQRLANNDKRNALIVEYAFKDMARGRSIMIPLTFRKHIDHIVDLINTRAGRKVAESFVGGTTKQAIAKREQTLERAKSGEIKVLVGIRSLLQLGLNIPILSAIYTVIPISNEPNYKQETSRVRTKVEGKPQPIIRLFYEDMGQSIGCARNCVSQMQKFKYEFSTDTKTQGHLKTFEGLARSKSGYFDEDCGEDDVAARSRYFSDTQAYSDTDGINSFKRRAARRPMKRK